MIVSPSKADRDGSDLVFLESAVWVTHFTIAII